MFLILGSSNSLTNRIYCKLKVRGRAVMFLDPQAFPQELLIACDNNIPSNGYLKPGPQMPRIPLECIEGVYWWYYAGIDCPEGQNYHETETALLTLFNHLDCLWVNSPKAVFSHRFKAYQSKLVKQLGVQIPDTLITNNPQEVAAFFDYHRGQVIKKCITASSVPEKLTQEAIEAMINLGLPLEPAMYQPFIHGTDVRVHVIGDRLFASEVHSNHWVSKVDIENPVPIELPKSIQQDCFKISQKLDLILTGIDFRKTPDNEYYFLEANPSPQYPVFEDRNNFPISDKIVEILMNPQSLEYEVAL